MTQKQFYLAFGVLVIAVCLAGIIFGNTKPNTTPAPAPSVEKIEESLNGVPTGDSYVLVIYTMSGTPDTGLLFRQNKRLEEMGYKMDPSTFRVSEGNSQCVMHAVYHKIK